MKDDSRVERLITMAERIITALEADIAILKEGKRDTVLATTDPEIQKLTAIYGREAQGFDVRIAQSAPPTLRQRFFTITAKFREVLQLHARMVLRVKSASEGLIRAIATEVERANAPARTYGPKPGYKPASPGAMVFNRIV
jgi:hypothetical protein